MAANIAIFGLNITVNWLEEQIQRAKSCSTASLQGDCFQALMGMAMRVKEFHSCGMSDLWDTFQYEDEVRLTGNELRILLGLAKRARKMRPILRVVASNPGNAITTAPV